jgi:hypothetical protein
MMLPIHRKQCLKKHRAFALPTAMVRRSNPELFRCGSGVASLLLCHRIALALPIINADAKGVYFDKEDRLVEKDIIGRVDGITDAVYADVLVKEGREAWLSNECGC